MNIRNNLESTLLKTTTTKEEIIDLCHDAEKNKLYGICVNPSYVELARATLPLDSRVKIITVVGFPLGQSTTCSKVYETLNAVKDGAHEIDMVLNIAKFKEGDFEYCLNEIYEIKKACSIRQLKVIVETALLTKDEKRSVCEMIKVSDADFIKTSTGFSTDGAEIETIKMWKSILNNVKKIKASGGISDYTDAKNFINAGADRIGTSKAALIMKEKYSSDSKNSIDVHDLENFDCGHVGRTFPCGHILIEKQTTNKSKSDKPKTTKPKTAKKSSKNKKSK